MFNEEIAEQASRQAAIEYDLQLLKLMQDNDLRDLFVDAINGLDKEALEKKGYMIVSTFDKDKNGYTIRLVKVLDTTSFELAVDVKISAMKMKGGE